MNVSAPEPRSPLEGHLAPGGHGMPGVTLAECRVPLHEIAARRGADLGLPPPGRAAPLFGGTALWIGPQTCLLLGGAPPDLPGESGVVNDQTGGFVLLHLAGPAVADLLARFCRLDLHRFTPGACARTLMAQMPVVIHRAGATAFELVLPATYAVSFVQGLLAAAAPIGCAVLPPVSARIAP